MSPAQASMANNPFFMAFTMNLIQQQKLQQQQQQQHQQQLQAPNGGSLSSGTVATPHGHWAANHPAMWSHNVGGKPLVASPGVMGGSPMIPIGSGGSAGSGTGVNMQPPGGNQQQSMFAAAMAAVANLYPYVNVPSGDSSVSGGAVAGLQSPVPGSNNWIMPPPPLQNSQFPRPSSQSIPMAAGAGSSLPMSSAPTNGSCLMQMGQSGSSNGGLLDE